MELTTNMSCADKRHSFRVPVHGVALVRWGGAASRRYAIDDVSLGGVALTGAPLPVRGTTIRTVLQIDTTPAMSMLGRVARVSATPGRRPGFAVAFDVVPAEAEDSIHDLSLTLLERADRQRVLIVGRSHPTRDTLGALIASAGWDVVTATTPLEAIVMLQNPAIDIRWMVVVAVLAVAPAAELLAFAADEHPGVRRLLITKEHDCATAMFSLRRRLAHACLLQPLRHHRIRRVLGDGPRNWRPSPLRTSAAR